MRILITFLYRAWHVHKNLLDFPCYNLFLCVMCKRMFLYVLKHEIPYGLLVLVWFLCRSDKIKPADVGLEQEAQLVRSWTASTQGPNGRRGRNGQYLPPIKYLHIHESESFSVRIFYIFSFFYFCMFKKMWQFSCKGPKKFHTTLYDFTLAKMQATNVIIILEKNMFNI